MKQFVSFLLTHSKDSSSPDANSTFEVTKIKPTSGIGSPDVPAPSKAVIVSEDPLVTFGRIQQNRVFRLFDRARDDCKMLIGNAASHAERTFAEVVTAYVEFLYEHDRGTLNSTDVREKIQSFFNTLSDKSFQTAFCTSRFPSWVLSGELARLEFLLVRFQSQYWSEARKKNIVHANRLRQIFVQSGHQDHALLFHHGNVLLDLGELAHVRQLLREALALAPAFAPYHLLAALVLIRESRFAEALECLDRVTQLLNYEDLVPMVVFYSAYCHYFLGDFEAAIRLSEAGIAVCPWDAGLRNNYAFARTRVARRDLKGNLWEAPDTAMSLLDEFVASIFRTGCNDTAHLNYALVLYWAMKEDKLDAARSVLAKHAARADLVNSPKLVEAAFERAGAASLGERNYFNVLMARYFWHRARMTPGTAAITSDLLDELLWDVDNFISYRHRAEDWRRSLLHKEPTVEPSLDADHVVALKRWMRSVRPRSYSDTHDGGGHFVKWHGKGIVVNPGAGFIDGFQRMGYSISEIDAILVSSSHYTGYEEFMRLVDLIDSAHEGKEEDGQVELYLHPRVFYRFPDIHARYGASIAEPQVLPRRTLSICEDTVLVEHLTAVDEDPSGGEGKRLRTRPLALLLHFMDKGTKASTIGFVSEAITSDSDMASVARCDLLSVSIGPIQPLQLLRPQLIKDLKNELMQLVTDDPLYADCLGLPADGDPSQILKNEHVFKQEVAPLAGWAGLETAFMLAEYLKDKHRVVVLGDMPPELADRRHKIAQVLNTTYPNGARFLTEDIGLVIKLPELKVLCDYGYEFASVDDLDEECAEGVLNGPVKHFCNKHRQENGFGAFLSSDFL